MNLETILIAGQKRMELFRTTVIHHYNIIISDKFIKINNNLKK